MATSEEILRVKLLDAKKSETELRAVRRELERTTGATSESGKASSSAAAAHEHSHRVLGGIKNILSYGGGLLGISAVGYGLKDITQGGIKAQEQQLLLQNALKQTGQTGSKHVGELNKAIDSTTGSGGFGAIEESEGLTQLVRLTKSSTQAIALNKDAILLARGAHESYGTALMQVGRIQTGQVGRLQRYLGIIQPVKYYEQQLSAEQKKRFPEKLKEAQLLDKEATAREANRRILERYGGAVQAYNKSTAGSISNANNAFKNVTEQLGQKLLPAETEAAKWFGKLVTEISKGEGVWKTVGHDISQVWHDLEGVYHFLERHKTLAKLLGYGAVAGVGTKLLSKAPGAGLLSKVLTAGGPAGEGAEGAAAAAGGLAAAPYLLAGGAAAAYGIETYKERHNLAANVEGALSMLGFGKGAPTGNLGRGLGIYTRTGSTGGAAAGSSAVAAQAAVVAKILEHPSLLTASTNLSAQQAQMLQAAVEKGIASHNPEIHMDSVKLGEVMRRNPRTRRELAEGVNTHAKTLNARG